MSVSTSTSTSYSESLSDSTSMSESLSTSIKRNTLDQNSHSISTNPANTLIDPSRMVMNYTGVSTEKMTYLYNSINQLNPGKGLEMNSHLNSEKLPQTGDDTNSEMVATIIGLEVIGMMALIVVAKRRKIDKKK
ncbi:LPXTG cell wall anchor domain-containing protein [Pediococcus claussenii]|uniref:LPXTG cell wall anchor domain-containing protein n=1 Tax=Pediococcus claussenii TaxID=187452 RepID=UPI0012E9EA78|nr:LPXTG cell wall anchor domain-containing protein [Pediococcus claussenii]